MFVLVQRSCFTMPLTNDLYRMSAKDWSDWRWALSFYGIENRLLLCTVQCVEQNASIHFSDYTRPVGYFRSAQISLLLVCIG